MNIIDALNMRLTEEFTAIAQYYAHRSLFDIQGYSQIVAMIDEHIADEEKHAGNLMQRIRFLGGVPIGLSKINPIQTKEGTIEMMTADLAGEDAAIKAYQETIILALQSGDAGTRAILEDNLKDEEDHHLDWVQQLGQIKDMTLQNYLSAKI